MKFHNLYQYIGKNLTDIVVIPQSDDCGSIIWTLVVSATTRKLSAYFITIHDEMARGGNI